jgi:hypothetical protein
MSPGSVMSRHAYFRALIGRCLPFNENIQQADTRTDDAFYQTRNRYTVGNPRRLDGDTNKSQLWP